MILHYTVSCNTEISIDHKNPYNIIRLKKHETPNKTQFQNKGLEYQHEANNKVRTPHEPEVSMSESC